METLQNQDIKNLIVILFNEKQYILKHYKGTNSLNQTDLLIQLKRRLFFKTIKHKIFILTEIINLLKEYNNL